MQMSPFSFKINDSLPDFFSEQEMYFYYFLGYSIYNSMNNSMNNDDNINYLFIGWWYGNSVRFIIYNQ